MNKIPSQIVNPNGLHQRYHIQKIVLEDGDLDWSDRGGGDRGFPKLVKKPVDKDAEYFVMRLDMGGTDINHIKACRIGIHAYAHAIEQFIPELSKDLIERYPLIGEETEGQDEQDKLWDEVEDIFDKNTSPTGGGYEADYTYKSGFISDCKEKFTLIKKQ